MKRKNWEFPTAYTVLFLILILVTVLTHIIPAGKYNRLSYQENSKDFVIESYGKDDEKLQAIYVATSDISLYRNNENWKKYAYLIK